MRSTCVLLALAALSLVASLASCGPGGVQVPTAVRIGGRCMGTSWSAVVTLQPGEKAEQVGALTMQYVNWWYIRFINIFKNVINLFSNIFSINYRESSM